MLTAALNPNLSGLFAEGDSIVVGATPDDEPLIVIRDDVVTLATGETVMAVALSPEQTATIAASLLVLAQACCATKDGKIDAERQYAVLKLFTDRTAELSTLDGAKRAAIDYAKRRPS